MGQLLSGFLHSAGEMIDFDIRILTQGRFSISECRAKNNVLMSSLSSWAGAYGSAWIAEKS